ncbi:MAG: hypothetical protein LBI33_00320 [Propionibacteriaceae bacterium]|jgi:hypothetical protein|nr:hypothetical protein [Propionibacteriaceae bacterium]
MVWLQIGGWIGSGLVVLSLTQARVLRFRWLNLTGSVIATAYNAILGIWPFVAMNGAICLINIYWLVRLNRERHSAAAYEVLEVSPNDPYLDHLLAQNATDMAASTPGFTPDEVDSGCCAFLVVRGSETVGMVVVRPRQGTEADVVLDWVSTRFRDFTPGEFVYGHSGIFAQHGLTRLRVVSPPEREHGYLTRMGFHAEEDGWVREIAG